MITKEERERGRDKPEAWQSAMCEIDKQQGFTVPHRGLYSIFCNNHNGIESEKKLLNHCTVHFNTIF